MGRRGEGLFHRRRASTTNSRRPCSRPTARSHAQGDKVGAYADDREGPHLRHQLRLPLDRERRGRQGPRQALWRRSIRCRRAACSCRRIRKIKTPEDLAGVPISVGYQSGSHYATIQALEQYMPLDKINLSFNDGMLFSRMELLFEGKIPACTLFSGPYYFAEQLGFRKVIDCTFMMATMITGDPDPEDVRKFFRALRARAARHRSAARALHALLQERIPEALSRHDGYAPLGTGRAHRVRAVFEGSVRGIARLDPRARHLRGQRSRARSPTTARSSRWRCRRCIRDACMPRPCAGHAASGDALCCSPLSRRAARQARP